MVWMSEAKLLSWTDGDMRETRKSRSSSGLRQASSQQFPLRSSVRGPLPRTCMSSHVCVLRVGPPVAHSTDSIHEAPCSKPSSLLPLPQFLSRFPSGPCVGPRIWRGQTS